MAPKICFVIAPIGLEDSETRRRSDQVLRHIIRPAVERRGYEAVRADEISTPGIITSQVIQHVVADDLVVADLTEQNPNVFYELALRHATEKRLVQIISKGEQVPFDVASMRTIAFDLRDLDSVAKCKEEILKQIDSVESPHTQIQTPISAAVELQTRITGSQFIHNAGLVDFKMNSRDVKDEEEWKHSKRLIVGVQYSPKFFKDFYGLIRHRSQTGLFTEALVVATGSAGATYLKEADPHNPQVETLVSEISQLLSDADAGRGLTSIRFHPHVLRYSFIQSDNFVWIKFFANSWGRTQVPAFKARVGSPLYQFVEEDTKRLRGNPSD